MDEWIVWVCGNRTIAVRKSAIIRIEEGPDSQAIIKTQDGTIMYTPLHTADVMTEVGAPSWGTIV